LPQSPSNGTWVYIVRAAFESGNPQFFIQQSPQYRTDNGGLAAAALGRRKKQPGNIQKRRFRHFPSPFLNTFIEH